jgi:hypothetical protein
MMMVGIPSNKSGLAAKFIRKSLPFMTKGDQDGLGYVALGDKGMFGERWLNYETAFRTRKRYTEQQSYLNDFFSTAVSGNMENYTSFGEGDISKASTILFHTRYATCGKNMQNTHPFVIDDTALIHNGVVLNHSDIMDFHDTQKHISTCDSEAILQEYLSTEVAKNSNNIQEVADLIDGWYACGVLTKNDLGDDIVDIFKCRNSSLYVGTVPQLECFVFCTEIGILQETAKAMRMSVSAYDEIIGGKLIRLDAKTGDRLDIVDFDAQPDKRLLKSLTSKSKVTDKWDWDSVCKDDVREWDNVSKDDALREWDYATDKWPAA